MCWKLCWVHGQSAQQGIVHEPADVTLCATMCSDRVYVVNEQKRVDLFGTNLDEMIQQVIMASSFYQAHREHALFGNNGPDARIVMHSYARGELLKKTPEMLTKLLLSVHAQLLYAVAYTFEARFAGLRKASKTQILDARNGLTAECAKELAGLRNLIMWLLHGMDHSTLTTILAEVTSQIPTLQKAAIGQLKLPETASGQIQDEITGANSGRARKVPGGDGNKKNSPSKPPKHPSGKRGKAGEATPGPAGALFGTPSSDEFARKLMSQLGRGTSEEDVTALRDKLHGETLRADREKLRADTAEKNELGLRSELTELRKQVNSQAALPLNAEAEETQTLKATIAGLRAEIKTKDASLNDMRHSQAMWSAMFMAKTDVQVDTFQALMNATQQAGKGAGSSGGTSQME
jgi:hypothetical protein